MRPRSRSSLHTIFAFTLLVQAAACGADQGSASAPPQPTQAPSIAPTPAPSAASDAPDAAPAPKPPMLELQQKAVRGMVAAFNAHDAKALAGFYAPQALVRSPSRDGFKDETGREAIEKGHAALFAAYPDIMLGTESVYVSGDVAVWTWITGNYSFEGGGSPPKKTHFGFHGASVLTFAPDGLITEDHTYFDTMTMAGQLGKLPKATRVRSITGVPAKELWWREAQGNETERKGLKTLKRVYDALARGDEKAFLAPLDDKGQHRQMSAPDSIEKVEAKIAFAAFRKAFKEPKLLSTRAWGIDLDVISETALTATHGGRPVTLSFLDRVSVTRDGEWILGADTYDNRAELLAQLSATPPAPAKK